MFGPPAAGGQAVLSAAATPPPSPSRDYRPRGQEGESRGNYDGKREFPRPVPRCFKCGSERHRMRECVLYKDSKLPKETCKICGLGRHPETDCKFRNFYPTPEPTEQPKN